MWTVCRCVSNQYKSQFHWNVSLTHHFFPEKGIHETKQLDLVVFYKQGCYIRLLMFMDNIVYAYKKYELCLLIYQK